MDVRVLDNRRLKAIGVILPVAFVVLLDLVRGDRVLSAGTRSTYLAVTVLCIAGFAVAMFHFIDRAQREILRQNRELAAVNAVSSALRGRHDVDQLLDLALSSLVASGIAAKASVDLVGEGLSTPDPGALTRRTASLPGTAGKGAGICGKAVQIPLTTGTSVVGRLRVLLHAPLGGPDGLSGNTLATIGRQIASAIELAQVLDDLERVNREGRAFQDVLLRISHQQAPTEVLEAVVGHAKEFLAADDAVLCLGEESTRVIRLDRPAPLGDRPVLVDDTAVHEHHELCPVRSSSGCPTSLVVPLRDPSGDLGELWVARLTPGGFGDREEAFVRTLCELASVALTGAQERESGRQGVIVAERERIAREMHDSLAQVLGVTHLRLRALDGRVEVKAAREVATELAALADICEEAYHDVREAILGLRQSCRAERGLLDSMSAYLAKYSDQCGIETTLVTELEHELALSPSCEVQMIRVIQEALTNVRKHSGARSATVRITESETSTTFVVEDDGYGFDPGGPPAQRDRFGLFTMRERMGLLNGSLVIDSAPGQGTRVIAGVPERSLRRPRSG
jgi:two-component system nitrate/nitrite sensor histidine kinase NarX